MYCNLFYNWRAGVIFEFSLLANSMYYCSIYIGIVAVTIYYYSSS